MTTSRSITIEDVFHAISCDNTRGTDDTPTYTETIKQFINAHVNDPKTLVQLLEIFIKDPTFPIIKEQKNFLLNYAIQHKQHRFLSRFHMGVDRLLLEAMQRGFTPDIIRNRFIKKGAQLNAELTDIYDKTALHYAVEKKEPDLILIRDLLASAHRTTALDNLLMQFVNDSVGKNNMELSSLLTKFSDTLAPSTQEAEIDMLEDEIPCPTTPTLSNTNGTLFCAEVLDLNSPPKKRPSTENESAAKRTRITMSPLD